MFKYTSESLNVNSGKYEIVIFSVMTLCSLVKGYQGFSTNLYYCLQGETTAFPLTMSLFTYYPISEGKNFSFCRTKSLALKESGEWRYKYMHS
jgi:hypothetical protein